MFITQILVKKVYYFVCINKYFYEAMYASCIILLYLIEQDKTLLIQLFADLGILRDITRLSSKISVGRDSVNGEIYMSSGKAGY